MYVVHRPAKAITCKQSYQITLGTCFMEKLHMHDVTIYVLIYAVLFYNLIQHFLLPFSRLPHHQKKSHTHRHTPSNAEHSKKKKNLIFAQACFFAIVFKALPSLNHSNWGSLKVCDSFVSHDFPFLGCTLSVTGLPTASSVQRRSTLSSGLILS